MNWDMSWLILGFALGMLANAIGLFIDDARNRRSHRELLGHIAALEKRIAAAEGDPLSQGAQYRAMLERVMAKLDEKGATEEKGG